MKRLWVVMPVFNEEGAIKHVVEEWLLALRHHCGEEFQLCILNDGSTDNTLPFLRHLEARHPEVTVVDKTNSGHGQTCMHGYSLGVSNGAEWVFQIDSDGQCDPTYFGQFWDLRKQFDAIYGYRKHREDGISRYLISRVVSLVALLATRVWVRDANVPYRLMKTHALAPLLSSVPPDFHLANILVSVLMQNRESIRWIPIGFRNRHGGRPSVKTCSFARHGLKLLLQLRKLFKARTRQSVDGARCNSWSLALAPSKRNLK